MKYLLEFDSETEMDEWALERVENIKLRGGVRKRGFDQDKLGDRQKQVLNLFLDRREYTTKSVRETLGMPGPNATSVLQSLEARKLIRKVRWGTWQLHPDFPLEESD